MRFCIIYINLAVTLSATSLYWSSPTATPVLLGLSSVSEINNSGVAVGQVGGPFGQAAEVSVSSFSVVLLGIPGSSSAQAINASGQILGTTMSQGVYSAFFWSQSAGIIPVGNLGGNLSTGFAINSQGQIVGQTSDGSNNPRAFLWSLGSGISQIGDTASYIAYDINDNGLIAYGEDPFPFTVVYSAVGGTSSPRLF